MLLTVEESKNMSEELDEESVEQVTYYDSMLVKDKVEGGKAKAGAEEKREVLDEEKEG